MKEDWIECNLGNVCFTTSGGTPNRQNKSFYEGKIPWIKSGELDKGIILDSQEHISEDAIKNSSAKIFPKGTLLFALYGATIGKMATLGIAAATNQAICGIYENDVLISKYLYHYLSYKKRELIGKGIGGAQPNISQTILKQLLISIAPLPEQRAIVAKIEELFSDLDKGIADLKTAQDQLVIYRQAVLKKAFEGELTKEWREKQNNLPTADELLEQIKVERENHYKLQIEDWKRTVKTWEINSIKNERKPLKPKKFKELDDFLSDELDELALLPKGWIWMKNENYLFEVKDGTHDTPKYVEKGIPFITQKNIKNNNVTFDDVKYISIEDHNKFYKRSNVSFGDIIIAMIGHGRGNSCIVNTDKVFSIKNVGLFKFFNSLQSNIYALNYYQSTLGLNLALKKSKGGAQPFIGLTELRNWPIPVCSIKEQHQIVKEIESRLSVCEKVEQSINESLEKAKALRKSILKKAFEGKLLTAAEITRCKQEKDYEPAAVLLEKIKVEKKKSS